MGGNCCKWLKKEAVANTHAEEVKEALLDQDQIDISDNRDLEAELLKAAEFVTRNHYLNCYWKELM